MFHPVKAGRPQVNASAIFVLCERQFFAALMPWAISSGSTPRAASFIQPWDRVSLAEEGVHSARRTLRGLLEGARILSSQLQLRHAKIQTSNPFASFAILSEFPQPQPPRPADQASVRFVKSFSRERGRGLACGRPGCCWRRRRGRLDVFVVVGVNPFRACGPSSCGRRAGMNAVVVAGGGGEEDGGIGRARAQVVVRRPLRKAHWRAGGRRIRPSTTRRRAGGDSGACGAGGPGERPREEIGIAGDHAADQQATVEPPWMPRWRGEVTPRAMRSRATAAKSS